MSKSPIRVCITGAAGQIGYSLIFLVANGDMFGEDQPLILHLLDIPQMMGVLNGVVMEIEDCAFPLVKGIVATGQALEGFKDVDYAILVGSMPRREGMERKDLLKANCGIFKEQGKALNTVAKKHVKVLVVGNPANTNCLIAIASAPDLPKSNFTCLTRLDHNRALSQLSKKLNVSIEKVSNVIIWGNHSRTQYPDVTHAYVVHSDGSHQPIRKALSQSEDWLNSEFISTVQQRGGAVIAARKLSSAASAAKAITDHMHDWVFGTKNEQIISMGVYSNGEYGTQKGLVFSFPVRVKNGEYEIVKGLEVNEFSKKKLQETEDELKEEKEEASEFLKD